ncbi:DUF975 family protein [Paenibacillus radicis (ex Gao et al. 2016)]|uniref:DUF975 family protein n=1 Tax=Paenibacillus radicis (ex Gao et al. 2016) TaxID=1737354 RepID=A0A917LY62_9BACL|nr:DUF975 family protein [Paenibacillus radicis (ex Gao et al. 2016)]GGG65537.1 hypothetical protein GCM10010918_19740 [Paenibacillus radicis (ex Gao et al. 2016)]
MWDRKELKQRAKQVLRTSYWKAFLVGIILTVVSGGISPPSFNFNFGSSGSTRDFEWSGGDIDWGIFGPILAFIIVIFIVIFLFAIAFRIFLGFPFEAGAMRYFKGSAEQEVNLNHLMYAFNKFRYLDIVKTMLWRAFLTFLWSLLLVIPGIIKSYSYSQVPFILADNPNIGYRRAVDLSRQMTRGHKFNIFVIDLSFLGWILLGTLALFVGVLFVLPYINATKAELYLALRQEALDKGFTNEEELRLNQTPVF